MKNNYLKKLCLFAAFFMTATLTGQAETKNEIKVLDKVEVEMQSNEDESSMKKVEITESDKKADMSERTVKDIGEIVSNSRYDGEKAAESLNKLENDDMFQLGVKEVLNSYYSEENKNIRSSSDELNNFEREIDTRAEKIVEEYKEAAEERDSQDNLDYKAGEILVMFREDVKKEEAEEIAEDMGGELEWKETPFENSDWEELPENKKKQLIKLKQENPPVFAVIDISLGQTVRRAMITADEYPEIVCVEQNNIYETEGELTDDLYADKQYTYFNTINIKTAWNEVPGFSPAWVAVIDSGMETSHPDLKNMYLKDRSVDITSSGYKKLDDPSLPRQYIDSHGTFVGGVIAAQSNNGIGVSGVATGVDNGLCRLMEIQTSRLYNGKAALYDADILAAINYSVANGADVINMSLAGYGKQNSKLYETALKYAYNNNVVVVAAASNDNTSKEAYPAAYTFMQDGAEIDPVIGVMAVYGENKTSYSNYGDWVDISAPGGGVNAGEVTIYSTTINHSYSGAAGTSLSAPLVSGVAAILKAQRNSITPAEVKSILVSTATTLSGKNTKGRINAGLAVQEMMRREIKRMSITCSAKASSYNRVKISWDETGYDDYFVDRYLIYRSTSANGTYSKIGTAESLSSDYTDSDVDVNTTYYYKVLPQVTYAEGYRSGNFSTIASATPKLTAPAVTTAGLSKSAKLSWKQVAGATAYSIYVSDEANGTYTRIKTISEGNILTHTEPGLVSGKKYYFKMRTIRKVNNINQYSGFSEAAACIPK